MTWFNSFLHKTFFQNIYIYISVTKSDYTFEYLYEKLAMMHNETRQAINWDSKISRFNFTTNYSWHALLTTLLTTTNCTDMSPQANISLIIFCIRRSPKRWNVHSVNYTGVSEEPHIAIQNDRHFELYHIWHLEGFLKSLHI